MPVGILTYANLVVARGRDSLSFLPAGGGGRRRFSVLVADVPMFEAAPFLGLRARAPASRRC